MISSAVERLLSLLKWSPSTDTKVFASILLPGLCSNTDAFLTLYRSGVFQTSSPLAAMSRFAVKTITLHNISNVGDEYLGYLSVRVEDLEQSKPYAFIIERTSIGSPDNRVLSSEPRIPLMPMNEISSPSSYLSLTPALPTKSQHTRLESASPTSVQGAHALARSRESLANDVILGAGYMRKAWYRSTRVVRKVTPSKLTLFELALLADVVHNVAAIHSLFENHRYWFMKIICDAIVALSDGNYTDDDQDNDINNQPYQSPLNSPLSPHSLSGTWNSVGDVRDRVLVDVLSSFSKRRDEEMAEVCFPNSASSVHLQNHLKIQKFSEALFLDDSEEMERIAINREAEIQGLQSDMTNLQGEMVDLLNKWHKFEGGNMNVNSSSSNSAGVCTQSLANTGLNKHSQHGRLSHPSQSDKSFH